MLIGLGVFALTVTLFYAEENWRGKRAWHKYKLRLEAKGKSLDWTAYIPPPVPDDQNIFKAPHMEGFKKGNGTNEFLTVRAGRSHELVVAKLVVVVPGRTSEPAFADFHDAASPAEALAEIERRASRRALAAQGVITLVADDMRQMTPVRIALASEKNLSSEELRKLLPGFTVRPTGANAFAVVLENTVSAGDYLARAATAEDNLKALREALKRPFARLDGDYQVPFRTPIQNFVRIRVVSQTLAQRAQSFLLLGKPEEALAELTLIQKMRGMFEAPPGRKPSTLVAAMINVAINGLYVSVVQDGLRLKAWRDAELAALGEQLKGIGLLPLVSESLNHEMAAATHLGQIVPLSKIFRLAEDAKRFSIFDLLPQGWAYQNIITYAKMMEQQIDSIESALPLIVPRRIDQAAEAIETGLARSSPFIYLARVAIPNSGKALQTAARNQTIVNQAQIVCALERYRLARQEYPAGLEELVPQFLPAIPRDLIGGDAPRYRRISDGKFLLYSVGWNGKDDGGQSDADPKQGDWIWTWNLNR